jgi:ZIP family zinc transporter
LVDIQTGLTTSVVLALHNIPEGIAISATALLAGYGRKIALLLTLAATLAEALGAFAVYFSGSLLLSDRSIGLLLSGVAGIMIAICARELIPYSLKTLGSRKN